MRGYGSAFGAATILNAVASWKGSAFGIELKTSAEVELNTSGCIKGDVPGIDTRLIERCVESVLKYFDLSYGGFVRTWSEIPVASGLKSSSTAANAVVLATLDALDEDLDLLEAAKIGVRAARETGVTITGALDDALASMLGGVVVTDNKEMKLLRREELESNVLLLVPEKCLFTRDTDVKRSRLIKPLADVAFDLAMESEYEKAMTLNGFIYCGALGLPIEPILRALESGVQGVSLSGTGPSYVALVNEDILKNLEQVWKELGGKVIRTKVNNNPATKGRGV
ncbi:MAG: shikimate kinase [Methanotrichaceae archaeon]|nr:shikimate kinase [Methanotrichaceae archaeon]